MEIFAGICVSVLIGGLIGLTNGRVVAGLVLGLLGPVGWLIAFLLDDKRPRCPACKGVVPDGAAVCGRCHMPLVSRRQLVAEDDGLEPGFCVKCGEDGLSTAELGKIVDRCPKCGVKL